MTTTPAITGTGHAIAAGEGERLWIVGDTMTFKATGESTGGSLMLFENLTTPGGGPPPHIHTREDEFWYVLDGSFEIRIGDEVHAVGPGGFAYAPRGTVHNFRNTAETPSRILVGFTPAGMEGFFRESGRPATDDGQAPPVDQDEIGRTMAAAPKYGVEAVAFDTRPVGQHPHRGGVMRRAIVVGTILVAILLAGSVAAGAANAAAAVVVNDAGCVTNFFGTTCTVIKTTTNTTATPSGNVSYVTNGTVERRIEFSFGGSYTSSSNIHVHSLAKQGEIRTSSEHYEELIDYVSGTWFTSCASSFDIHWTNGDVQFSRSELACETP